MSDHIVDCSLDSSYDYRRERVNTQNLIIHIIISVKDLSSGTPILMSSFKMFRGEKLCLVCGTGSKLIRFRIFWLFLSYPDRK